MKPLCLLIAISLLPTLADAKSIARYQGLTAEGPHLNFQTFRNCKALETAIEEALIEALNQSYSNALSNNHRYYDARKQMPLRSQMKGRGNKLLPQAKKASKEKNDSPNAFTTTNNQVANVEEGDFVKTTGNTIFHLANGKLEISKSWPANELRWVKTLPFAGAPQALLLVDSTRLVVVTTSQVKYHTRTTAHVVDVSSPEDAKVVDTYEISGRFHTARRSGKKIRLVLHDGHVQPTPTVWPQFRPNEGFMERVNRYTRAYQENVTRIREQTLRHWLGAPSGKDRINCRQALLPENWNAQQGFTRVATIDLENKRTSHNVIFLPTQYVYANEKALYLTHYIHGPYLKGYQGTAIHKFTLSEGAKYAGNRVVRGYILNQFAMDEYQNHLRLAIHDAGKNKVIVLREKNGNLDQVGETPDLAPGERIYSVRFNGPKGFLVTFRQVDPLFTLDLSEHNSPQVMGELKIPGYSSYMHLMDEHNLLAVGQDADPKTGRPKGLKLSIFNVKDMNNPKEAHTYYYGGPSTSAAQTDHKAFTYFAQKGYLAIPVTAQRNRGYGSYQSSLLVFKVDAKKGVKHRGTLSMSNLYQGRKCGFGRWRHLSQVFRSLFADDYVYALSQSGIRVARLDNLETSIASVHYFGERKPTARKVNSDSKAPRRVVELR